MKKILLSVCSLAVLSFASQKIVSVGAGMTETVCALGHEKDIIAVDLTSMYPKSMNKLPKVGYWLNLSKEGILSLKPDIVIASDKSKPKEVLNSLKDFGIKTYLVDDKPSFKSALNTISQIGDILKEKQKAKNIIARINTNISKVQKEIKQTNKKVLFLFSRGTDKVMVVGKNTDANFLIEESGAKNIADFSSFRTMTKEAIVKANPDVIIIGDIQGARYDINNLHDESLKLTNAYKNKQIYTIDMILVSSFSARLDKAYMKMSCLLNNNKLSFCKD